jgi:peroxiredoxin
MTHAYRTALASIALSLAIGAFGAACQPEAPASGSSTPTKDPAAGSTVNNKDQAGTAKGTPAVASSGPEIGKPAPDFRLTDLDGKEHKLSALKGKTVVLEWFNPGCPFVKANYSQGSLKGMAKRHTDKGVVWLTINSGAAGKQGAGAEANKEGREKFAMTTPILLDESGEVGRAYGAKTTPHMYIVNPEGVLVYKGAIDNTPGSDPEKDEKVINYVEDALNELAAGKPITTKETEPYGCSVKYASK